MSIILTHFGLGAMDKVPGRSTCCRWFQQMFSASIAVATIEWDPVGKPEFCISSDGTKYKYDEVYAQALHVTAEDAKPLTISLGTSIIPDETCATTVELSNHSVVKLARAAAVFEKEAAIGKRHQVAIRADHANNAYKSKQNCIQKQKDADEAMEGDLDTLTPMQRAQCTEIVAWGCSDHKIDNAAKGGHPWLRVLLATAAAETIVIAQ